MSLPNLPELPINDILPELLAALAVSPAAVLTAEPGSGKTTIAPLALLDQPWLADRKIIILEPRRLAARAAAARLSELVGDKVGNTIGYRVRFDSKVSRATRIEVVTEGILIRMLQNDPALCGTGLVIFDEFHERSLQGDLALALCMDVRQLRQRVVRQFDHVLGNQLHKPGKRRYQPCQRFERDRCADDRRDRQGQPPYPDAPAHFPDNANAESVICHRIAREHRFEHPVRVVFLALNHVDDL